MPEAPLQTAALGGLTASRTTPVALPTLEHDLHPAHARDSSTSGNDSEGREARNSAACRAQ